MLYIQYWKHGKLVRTRIVLTYFFALYLIGLVAFTLYPLPDNTAD